MTTDRRAFSAGLLGLAAAGSCAAADVRPDGTRLQAMLQGLIDDGVPGAALRVGGGKGAGWAGAAGFDDLVHRTPLSLDAAMGVGSITKTFVVVVALQLAAEGRLDLNATVEAAVGPELSAQIPNAGTATLAQLMNHTSGIPSWEDDPAWIRDGRGANVDPKKIWRRDETLDYIRGHAPLAAPGAAYSYANTNHTLLGLAIERVVKGPLEAELERRIFRPLGLEHTWLEGFTRPAKATTSAHRYHYRTEAFVRDAGVSPHFPEVGTELIDVSSSNLSTEWAAGGLVMPTADLLKFAIGLRDGRLVGAPQMAFMQDWRPAATGVEVGHGLFRMQVGSHRTIGHTGGVLGSCAQFFWIEGGSAAAAYLTNVGVMHIGAKKPATRLLRDPETIDLIARLAG
jgi:D-alanyl-D-alanine carboxypeptidase